MTAWAEKIWNEFIYGGHLLSLGASAIVFSGALIINSGINLGLIVIPYLLSQSIYSFNHYLELKEDIESNPERATHLANKSMKSSIALYVALLVFFLLFYGNISASVFILVVLIFGIYYPKNLTSKIIGFKNLYVSLFWALSIVFLALYTNIKFELTLLILFIFVFLRFIVSTVFFDLKDIESDKKEGLKTIPTVFGLRGTTRLLNIVNLVSVLLLVSAIYFRILPVYSVSLVLFFFYDLYYVIWGAKKEKGVLRFISYVVVDGEYIFWPIILIFFKLIME